MTLKSVLRAMEDKTGKGVCYAGHVGDFLEEENSEVRQVKVSPERTVEWESPSRACNSPVSGGILRNRALLTATL